MVSIRPSAKVDLRQKYMQWSKKFRQERSESCFKLRPVTYRRIFNEETGGT